MCKDCGGVIFDVMLRSSDEVDSLHVSLELHGFFFGIACIQCGGVGGQDPLRIHASGVTVHPPRLGLLRVSGLINQLSIKHSLR